MYSMRRIVLRVCTAVGVVTITLVVVLFAVIIREWPHTPDAPGGRVESPPWGSLDAAIEEAQSRGETVPPFVADAEYGPAADGKLRVLILSAGGQYGAFGAGTLTGWTRSGDWPDFDVVTGISVGSILAPIAFLGSEYDEQLKQMVQNIAAVVDRYPIKDIGPVELLGAIWGRGFPVSAKIESILRGFYDETFIAQIAREHANGRNLYIASTDVTAGRVVIWDLGAIAGSMRADRVQRFQDAILASIAVPVAMPVRFIETGRPGTYALHVDGSFLAPLFMTTLLGNFKDLPVNFEVYVVVNNRLKRPQPLEPMKPRLVELVPRLFYLVHTSQFERTMDLLLLQSQIHHFTVRILAIPENEDLKFSLDFSGQEITELFRLGVRTGKDSKVWITLPATGLPAYWAPAETMVKHPDAAGETR
jgi:predicted acylesterase/phospholipase RssA